MMTQLFDQDLDSLDLYMEVLRIVHRHPGSSSATVFEHATLAMDATSCQNALDSLIHQGLVHMASNQYTITASGVQTLIPAKRDGKFPTGTAQSYMDVLPPVVTPATLQVVTKNGVCTITKDDVSIQLSAEEIQQLWKKLLREADQNN